MDCRSGFIPRLVLVGRMKESRDKLAPTVVRKAGCRLGSMIRLGCALCSRYVDIRYN